MFDKISDSILTLAREVRALREQEKNEFDLQVAKLATKQDLNEMEKRLTNAITKSISIAPSIETAVLRVQVALDRLDSTIPDK